MEGLRNHSKLKHALHSNDGSNGQKRVYCFHLRFSRANKLLSKFSSRSADEVLNQWVGNGWKQLHRSWIRTFALFPVWWQFVARSTWTKVAPLWVGTDVVTGMVSSLAFVNVWRQVKENWWEVGGRPMDVFFIAEKTTTKNEKNKQTEN